MPTAERQSINPPRIAAHLQAGGNAALIREILTERGAVAGEIGLDDAGRSMFDLAIVDPPMLARLRDQLQHCRTVLASVVLPVLLIVDGTRSEAERATSELGSTVDDVLRVPTSRAELSARIDNLLRLRTLSRELCEQYEHVNLQLRGANRALRALHAGNEVLVRAHNEQELLQEICRVIVDEERYELAWAGFVRSGDDPEIVIDAMAGDHLEYAEQLRVTRSRIGEGPAWRAVDTGDVVVAEDLQNEPSVEVYRRDLRAQGLASAITLPIRPGSGAPGVLVIYSATPGGFADEERELLARLAGNIEFGINALRTSRERDRQKEEIRGLAYTDPVTGLPNRHHVVEHLDGLLDANDQPQNVAILFIDLDRFKIINDALGHRAGDTLLRQIGQRLRRVVRPEDIVARQGGDEFIIVMAEPPRSHEWRQAATESRGFAAAARALATRLAQRIVEPIIIEGTEHRVSASIGISLYPEHAGNANELVERADTAMYAAKSAEDNIRTYAEAIAVHRQRRLSLEARLYHALDAGEFALHYQPVFDLVSGTIQGAEALIRWPQSDGSWISPGEFMPVTEETGLIVPLGEWVLRTAVAQRAAWMRAGDDVTMAINVSVLQLRQKEAIDGMLVAIGNAVDPSRIELEVTESGLMDQGDRVGKTVKALHERGFHIAVDDFGTGYSSLSRLQEMPINTLKIDKSFVADLEGDRRGAVISRTIQQLADTLGFRVLAEGIETERQRQLLVEQGCRVGQGFLVSGAVPADAFIRMVQQQRDQEPDTGWHAGA